MTQEERAKNLGQMPVIPCESMPDGSISMRDYIATQAMLGSLSSWPSDGAFAYESIAKSAYKMADAMLMESVKQ